MTQLLNVIRTVQETAAPSPGAGATKVLYTDRHAYTIRRVSPSGKSFWMTRDVVTRVDDGGRTDSGQEYRYETSDSEPEVMVRLTRNGWRGRGRRGAGEPVGTPRRAA